jgi:hypothetical protein
MAQRAWGGVMTGKWQEGSCGGEGREIRKKGSKVMT